MATTLDELGLPPQTLRALKGFMEREGLSALKQFSWVPDAPLLALKGMGPKRLEVFRAALAELGAVVLGTCVSSERSPDHWKDFMPKSSTHHLPRRPPDTDMPTTAPKKSSPARDFTLTMWESSKRHGSSWTRLNTVLYSTVRLAIEGDMDFAPDDFSYFMKDLRGGYWFHDHGGSLGEGFYCSAVKFDNLSACKAFEQWRVREPYLLDTGARVAVGHEVDWNGERTFLTSFNDPEGHIILCSYKREDEGLQECPKCKSYIGKGDTRSILHRYTVSHAEWTAEMKLRKAKRTPPPRGTLVVDAKGVEWIVTDCTTRDEGKLSLETRQRGSKDALREPMGYIDSMKYPAFLASGFKVKAPPPKLTPGTLLVRNGEEWRVTWADKSGAVSVETVARRKDSTWAEDSHSHLTVGGFYALGFTVKDEGSKAKRKRD